MNNWLKVALYSFIGISIGSILLGILSTNNGYSANATMWNRPYGYNMMMNNPNMGMGMGMGMHNGMMMGGMQNR